MSMHRSLHDPGYPSIANYHLRTTNRQTPLEVPSGAGTKCRPALARNNSSAWYCYREVSQSRGVFASTTVGSKVFLMHKPCVIQFTQDRGSMQYSIHCKGHARCCPSTVTAHCGRPCSELRMKVLEKLRFWMIGCIEIDMRFSRQFR